MARDEVFRGTGRDRFFGGRGWDARRRSGVRGETMFETFEPRRLFEVRSLFDDGSLQAVAVTDDTVGLPGVELFVNGVRIERQDDRDTQDLWQGIDILRAVTANEGKSRVAREVIANGSIRPAYTLERGRGSVLGSSVFPFPSFRIDGGIANFSPTWQRCDVRLSQTGLTIELVGIYGGNQATVISSHRYLSAQVGLSAIECTYTWIVGRDFSLDTTARGVGNDAFHLFTVSTTMLDLESGDYDATYLSTTSLSGLRTPVLIPDEPRDRYLFTPSTQPEIPNAGIFGVHKDQNASRSHNSASLEFSQFNISGIDDSMEMQGFLTAERKTAVDSLTVWPEMVGVDTSFQVNDRVTVTFRIEALPPQEYGMLAGGVEGFHGSVSTSGATVAAGVSPRNTLVGFSQDADGNWITENLNITTIGPQNITEVVSFTDTKDGRVYFAALSENGLALYINVGFNIWSVRNLNIELAGSPRLRIDSSLTTFTTPDGLVHIAGFAQADKLILFSQTGDRQVNGDFVWEARNLTDEDLLPQGLVLPKLVSNLTSYTFSWGAMNIAGYDASGDVYSVWTAPGMKRWTLTNVSELSSAPPVSGRLSALTTSWDGVNIVGGVLGDNVGSIWWAPALAGDWRFSNLTQIFLGPRMDAATLSAYVTPWGAQNIAGRSSSGSLVVYWWAPGANNNRWIVSNISSSVPQFVPPVGPITAGVAPSSASPLINLFYASAEGRAVRFSWVPSQGGTWVQEPLTAIAFSDNPFDD